MPIVRESEEQRKERIKEDKERRDLFYKEKQKDREKELTIASLPTKLSRWEIFFNAPARFVAIILSYRLIVKDKEVPEWMSKFIGGMK